MTTDWLPFPYAPAPSFDADALRAAWTGLHTLDAEPWPANAGVLDAWVRFHNGDFAGAAAGGEAAGPEGWAVANRATAAYATLIEPHEKVRLDLYRRIHERAQRHAALMPESANAWFWTGYALSRYSQGITVARALAQGLGQQVQQALEKTVALEPGHAFGHLALGGFHAEIIDKVGTLVGAITYSARPDLALNHLNEAARLAPGAPVVLVETAHALLMLEGPTRVEEAERLYQQAAALTPRDASERLWIELARAGLTL